MAETRVHLVGFGVAVTLFATLAVALCGTAFAQEGAVLVTEGIGPRAAAALRRDLAERWDRPVVALHEEGARNASHQVSVSVHQGSITVQYRHGSTIRTERGRAGARRSLLLDTVMTAVGSSGARHASEPAGPGAAARQASAPTGPGATRVRGALLALESGEPDTLPAELPRTAEPRERRATESGEMRSDDGMTIAQPRRGRPSTDTDPDAVVREIPATGLSLDGREGGVVLLAIE